MSQNRDDVVRTTSDIDTTNTTRGTGYAGTGATDAGTMRDTSTGMTTLPSTTGTSSTQNTGQAQQYSQKISDAATQAKDYVTDKFSTVSDKIKDLQNKDYNQVAEDAKQYARQNPGQALAISAAVGFLIGVLLRGGSKRRY